ncbi:MAG: peptidoglycan editing factor PgeF, partial [Thermoanaerobaculia bacterium]
SLSLRERAGVRAPQSSRTMLFVSYGTWREEVVGDIAVFRPGEALDGLLVAFSGRGVAPAEEPSPTSFLARRFARALSLDAKPIVRATQVHGNRAASVRESPPPGAVLDAGECDVLATDLSGVALAVQTADCVPILLASEEAIATVHAGWRGTAQNAAGAAVRALAELGAAPSSLRAWLGPSIGSCCYEVGSEVAAQFAGEFLRASCGGRFRLDVAAVNRAQLEAAGVPPTGISVHPACTKCGGEKYASYRRDGAAAGRMIGLVMRLGWG